jgi:hypothetical protein
MSRTTQDLAAALPAAEKLAQLALELRRKAAQEVDLGDEDYHETQYARQLLKLIDPPRNQEAQHAAA